MMSRGGSRKQKKNNYHVPLAEMAREAELRTYGKNKANNRRENAMSIASHGGLNHGGSKGGPPSRSVEGSAASKLRSKLNSRMQGKQPLMRGKTPETSEMFDSIKSRENAPHSTALINLSIPNRLKKQSEGLA